MQDTTVQKIDNSKLSHSEYMHIRDVFKVLKQHKDILKEYDIDFDVFLYISHKNDIRAVKLSDSKLYRMQVTDAIFLGNDSVDIVLHSDGMQIML